MTIPPIQIQNRLVGPGQPCFVVAELSGNHHQKYEEAVELVKRAAEAGADAIKLQTYTPDTITIKSDREWFIVKGENQPGSWKKKVLWDLYNTAYTPWEWQPKLKELAESLGLLLFSTPFDDTAVDFLKRMDVPCYKIASYEAVHIPLLQKVAKTGKPVIMSVGFASLEEVDLAIKTLRENGSKDIAVLHCVTAYSDTPVLENANARVIRDIQNRFGVVAGFSDNNSGIEIPIIATVIGGASVLEKHLILDKTSGGPDSRFSIDPKEFKEMVAVIRKAEQEGESALQGVVSQEDVEKALGRVQYGPASKQEQENTFFRPSLWVTKDMKTGEEFTKENTRVARPSAGLLSHYWSDILGKKAAKNIDPATPLSWDLIQR
ncbi:MAG: N-acetylneuraminate synthase family protein [Candidatus Wildermuthbacteria bacterium]|nr:N-acetylneuraminate synthase family protein [Candidatus Wildermuthbacteria bacterium]